MKNTKKYLLLLLVFTVFLLMTSGCSNDKAEQDKINLNIQVVDEKTEDGIDGATINLEKESPFDFTVETDGEGKGSFTVDKDTDYQLNILKDNYYNIYGYSVSIGDKARELKIELLETIPGNSFEIDAGDEKTMDNIGTDQTSVKIEDEEVKDKLDETGVDEIAINEAGRDDTEEIQNLLQEGEQLSGTRLMFSFNGSRIVQSQGLEVDDLNLNEFSGFVEARVALKILGISEGGLSAGKYNMLAIIRNSRGKGRFRQPVLSTDSKYVYGMLPLLYKGELAESISLFLTYKADREQREEDKKIKSVAELKRIEVDDGTEFVDIKLPERISATRVDGFKVKVPVNWDENNTSPEYGPEEAGEYLVTGKLDLSGLDNLTNPEGIVASLIVKVAPPPNTAPVLEEIGNKNVNENEELKFVVNAEDVDGDELAYNARGDLEEYFDPKTQEFNWIPGYKDSGNYELIFTVSDGKLQDSEEVEITVSEVNQTPNFESIEDKSVNEGETLNFTVNASDPDGDSVSLSVDTLPEGASFDTASGQFEWVPGFQQNGNYEVTFKADDGKKSIEKTINIEVIDRNAAPEITSIRNVEEGKVTVAEDSELQLEVMATDPDGDELFYSVAGEDGEKFTRDMNNKNIFGWTPGYEDEGTYTIILEVNDGQESVSKEIEINVENTDRSPELEEMGDKEVDEGSNIKFTVSANDPDEDEVTLSGKNLPEGASFNPETGEFNWTPDYQQVGEYQVEFTAEAGGKSDTQTITITVNDRNAAPEIEDVSNIDEGKATVDEGDPLLLDITASDADGDALSYSIAGEDGGKFTQSVTYKYRFVWTPAYDESGDYSIILEVDDGQESVTKTIDFTLEVIPEPGVISGDIKLDTGNVTENVEVEVSANGKKTTTTIANGSSSASYELTDIAPGDYTVSAEVTGTAVGSYEIVSGDQGNVTVERATTTENINFSLNEFNYDGDGTEANPYKILNWEDLNNVRNNLDKHFILKKDLDRYSDYYYQYASTSANSFKGWLPIGVDFDNSFKGTFDGNGHVISHLNIKRKDASLVGLFGYIDGYEDEAEIRNLGLENINVTGRDQVGGLAGKIKSATIRECYVTGQVEAYYITGSNAADGRKAGGLVGVNWMGTVVDSYSTANVTGFSDVGGLVGINQSGSTISNGYAAGKVNGEQLSGGLAGSSYYGTVSKSYYDKDTTGQNTGKGTPEATAEMTNKDTFDWNFTSTWSIDEGHTYPYLSWQGRANSHNYPPNFGSIKGTIELDGYAVSQDVEVEVSAGTFGSTTVTIASGDKSTDYEIAQLRPGSYQVNAEVTGEAEGVYEIVSGDQNINVEESRSTTGIDFDLEFIPELGAISGEIGLEEKQVDRDVKVEINAKGDYDNETKTITISKNNEKAGYSIEDLWPDEYEVSAEVIGDAAGYYKLENGSQNTTLDAGGSAGNVDFNLSRFAGGEGTENDPYLINNWYHLYNVRQEKEAYFELSTDLNRHTAGYSEIAGSSANSGQGWKPIGEGNSGFAGSFNGNEYVIKDLYIDRENEDYTGLFGHLVADDSAGTQTIIKKLGVEYADISGSSKVGVIVGQNQGGQIEECYSTGAVKGYSEVGGLAGRNSNEGMVENTYSTVKVNYGNSEGGYNVGGLVGLNDSSILNSYAEGAVIGDSTEAGGLVGENNGSISYSYYNKETTDQNDTGKGTPRTTAEMKNSSQFTDWDFTQVWDIDEEETYPYLQWQGFAADYNIAPDPDGITITAHPEDIYAGDSTTLTATVTDADGDGIEGVWVEFGGGSGSWSQKKLITDGNGRATVEYTAHDNDVNNSVELNVSEQINNHSNSTSLEVTYKPEATVTSIETYPYRSPHQDYVAATVEFRGVEGDNVYIEASVGGTRLSQQPEEVTVSGARELMYLFYNGQAYDLHEGDRVTIDVYESYDNTVYPYEYGAKLTSATSDPVPHPPSATITNVEEIKAGDYQVTATVEFSGYISDGNVYLDLYMPHPDGGYFNITDGNPRLIENSGDTVSIDKVGGGAFESEDQVLIVVIDDRNDTYHSALDQEAIN